MHTEMGFTMRLGYFLVSYNREVLTAKSLSPISVEYPSPKDLSVGAGSCFTPS